MQSNDENRGRGQGRGRSRGRGRGRGRGEGAGSDHVAPPGTGGTSRGRGRGRGRGAGAGDDGVSNGDRVAAEASAVEAHTSGGISNIELDAALAQVRVQRQQTNSRVSRLDPATRKQLYARKRTAQLERMLLPDAPPRKRRTLNPSPVRVPLIFTSSHPAQNDGVEEDGAVAVAAALPAVSFTDEGVEEAVAAVTATESSLCDDTEGIGVAPADLDVTAGTPPVAEDVSPGVVIDYELLPGHTELRMVQASGVDAVQETSATGASDVQPSTSGTLGVNDGQFSSVVTNWLDTLTFDSDDDDDHDDNAEDAIALTASRTVTDIPTDNNGLSQLEVMTMMAEEAADDQFVRHLAPTTDCLQFDWSSERLTFTGRREVFTGSPGPTFPVTDDMTVVDIFEKMFDQDFIDMIVTETNRYASQTLTKLRADPTTPKNCRALLWTPTNRQEMVKFLAVIILQGLYPKVKEECYFTFDGYGTTPYFGRIMTYSRYYLLKRFLHFVDNETTDDGTKTYKIQPVIDYFNSKFAGLYNPKQNIAIDESLLKWHGRLSFSQKITSKAASVGVKTYELCESASGYLWSFRVYTGKDGPNRTRPTQLNERQDEDTQDDDRHELDRPEGNLIGSDFRPKNATAKIVYDLVEPLLNLGHTLIMDNFYNSPLLARCLKRTKTDVYGTLRLTREFVPESLKTMTKSDMRQGEVAASYCSDLAVMLWRDANFVSMISTFHHLQIGTTDKYDRTVFKPAIVLDYNKSMGGVDRKDQFLAGQPLERQRNKVWYKKLFRRLFNAALFNCFVIHTSNATHKMTHRQFRTMLAETLLRQYAQIDLKQEPRLNTQRLTTKTTRTPTATLTTRGTHRPYVEGNHFPVKTGSRYTRCWMCTHTNNQVTRTAFKCEECDVNLCIVGCFKAFHKPTLPTDVRIARPIDDRPAGPSTDARIDRPT